MGNDNDNHINLIYNVVEFMFYERQFEALQKILSYIHYISPLFKYLLARCNIEMEKTNNINNMIKNDKNNSTAITKMDQYVVNLINECCSYLQKPSKNNYNEKCLKNNYKEKCLLGLILTNDYNVNNNNNNHNKIDIYHLAPSDYIRFRKEFIKNKQMKEKQNDKHNRVI